MQQQRWVISGSWKWWRLIWKLSFLSQPAPWAGLPQGPMITNSGLGQRQISWARTGLHCSKVPQELVFPLLGPHTPSPNSLSMSTQEVEQEVPAVTEPIPWLCPGSPQSAAVLVAAIATWMHTNEAKAFLWQKQETSHLSVTIWFQKGSYSLTCFDKESGEDKHVSLEVKVVTMWPKWTESQLARLIKLMFTLIDNVPDSRFSCVH